MTVHFDEMDVTDGTRPIFHCVSADLRYGKGLAKQIKEKFGRMDLVAAQDHSVGCAVDTQIDGRIIFHLVTKERYHQKPTLNSLVMCLKELKDKALYRGIKSLQAPKYVSCGLDRLHWPTVLALIKETFQNTGIDIFICSLPHGSLDLRQRQRF